MYLFVSLHSACRIIVWQIKSTSLSHNVRLVELLFGGVVQDWELNSTVPMDW